MIQLDTVTANDLTRIGQLQPEGWSDITAEFRFFIANDFCHPIKIMEDKTMVGVGCSVIFQNSAWLAHIIVGSDYRNRGFGFQLVEHLLKDLKNRSIDTVSLIASPYGEPVYKKAGFSIVAEYSYLDRKKPWIEKAVSAKIRPYEDKFSGSIWQLDREISGEEREPLLKKYLDNSFVYIDSNEITGFYLPALGEGPILAVTPEAGTALMELKYAKADHAVLPGENQTGMDFLIQNGFELSETKGKRMILGKELTWQPQYVFSRISGDYG